jgi:hypothetical protein
MKKKIALTVLVVVLLGVVFSMLVSPVKGDTHMFPPLEEKSFSCSYFPAGCGAAITCEFTIKGESEFGSQSSWWCCNYDN